jgi:hypothetical protein
LLIPRSAPIATAAGRWAPVIAGDCGRVAGAFRRARHVVAVHRCRM